MHKSLFLPMRWLALSSLVGLLQCSINHRSLGQSLDGFNPNANNEVYSAVIQPDNKIILTGGFTTVGGSTRNRVALLNPSGTLDGSYNPNADGVVYNSVVFADGKLLVGGNFSNVGGASCTNLARLNSIGTLDAGFPGNSVVNGPLYCFAPQVDGKTVFSGPFPNVNNQSQWYVGRLNADGTVDATFHGGGSQFNYVDTVTIQPDKKVIIGGAALVRRTAGGNPDSGFNALITSGEVKAALVLPNEKILIGGSFSVVNGVSRKMLARLNSDGSLDSGFIADIPAGSVVTSLALQTDGMVIVAGTFSSVAGNTRNNVARLNPDGSLDTSFNPNANNSVYGITIQPDGSVLLAGTFTAVAGTARNRIARFGNNAATQSLTVTDAGRVLWMRGGSSPETHDVTFDLSTNGGASWAPLGTGTRVAGGWELTSLALPSSGMIRGRARFPCGFLNGSSSLVETTATFSNPTPVPEIAVEQPAGIGLADGDSTVNFGSVPHGSDASLDFTLRNHGGASLDNLAVSLEGPAAGDYTVTASPPSSITAAGTNTFTVRFRPSSSGTRVASLHLASNDQDENPFDINLAGTGLAPEIVVEQPAGTNLTDGTATATFNNTAAGTATSLTFTIRNQGNADLTGSGATIEGADAADFTVTAQPATPVTPAGSTTFVVRFAPATAGAKHAVLRLASNDPDESLFDINLDGQSLVPDSDADGDFLTNIQEYWLATNPDLPDSDGDGTTDGVEYNKGMNPLSIDSDGDGVSDAYEVANGLNPIRNDAGEDSDFDFITNLQEFTNGTKSNTAISGTDGISDYRRLNGKGTWRAYYDRNNRLNGQLFDNGTTIIQGYDRNSNPVRQILRHKADNDGDGLLDIWEVANGLDPNSDTSGPGDADNDGVTNLQEQAANTDPQSAASKTTNDGTVIATSSAFPWIPASYVMGTGQLDGTGIEEIVISGDGNPGAANNVLKIFTPDSTGTTWTEESVTVGPVGVTSICVGHTNAANTIFIGTRAVAPAVGQIIKYVKTAGVWMPTAMANSTDQVASVCGWTDWNSGQLIAQFTAPNYGGPNQYLMYLNLTATPASGGSRINSAQGHVADDVPRYARDGAGGVTVASRIQYATDDTRLQSAHISPAEGTLWRQNSVPSALSGLMNSNAYAVGITDSVARRADSPSWIQYRYLDTNGNGVADSEDQESMLEAGINNTALGSKITFVFAPVESRVASTPVFPSSITSSILITGSSDGIVSTWNAPFANSPLKQHLLTGAFRGKTWHEFRSLRGVESGDSAVGLYIDPTTPAEPKLALWKASDLAASAAATPLQTAPIARVASTPSTGGARSTVDVDIFDGEGNASRVVLQCRVNSIDAWSNATVLTLDGGSATAFVEASPTGTRHRLIWDAAADLGNFSGTIHLRTRATDAGDAGAWSVAMPYTVDMASSLDDDGDGFTNANELAFGTDPNSAASRPVLTATRLANGSLQLAWPAAAGHTYRLETSLDLSLWTPIQSGLSAGSANIPVGSLTAPKRFYRIAAE